MCRLRPNDEGPDHVARLSPLRRLAAPVRLLGLRRRARHKAWRGATRHGEEPKSQKLWSRAALERSFAEEVFFHSFSELSQRRWGPRPIDSIHSEASARPRHVVVATRPVSGSKRFSVKAPTDTASQPEAAEHVNLQRAERRSNPSPSDRLQTANRADTRRRPQTPSLPSPSPRSALGPPAPEPSLPLRPRGGAQASEPRLPPGQG